MKRPYWIAIALALLTAIAIALFLLTRPSAEPEQPATVVETVNRVDAHPRPGDDWLPALVNMRIYAGGQVRTGAASSARLELPDGLVRLSADTVFTVKQATSPGGQLATTLFLEAGRLWIHLTPDQPRQFTVETFNAVASVRDTRFSVRVASADTLLSVAEGEVLLTAQGRDVLVAAAQQATVESGRPPSPPEPLSDEERLLWATQGDMPALAPPTTGFTASGDFRAAISTLGTPTVIDFEDLDAGPVTDTYVGRAPFDGMRYAGLGVSFSSPQGLPLYLAPGGLFWNASNSLSVKDFPYDANARGATDDDLVVTFDPPVLAVGFTLLDNATYYPGEFVQFLDADGDLVEQLPLPPDFTPYRAFVGLLSADQPIATVNVVEAPDDGDDVAFDDFIFIR